MCVCPPPRMSPPLFIPNTFAGLYAYQVWTRGGEGAVSPPAPPTRGMHEGVGSHLHTGGDRNAAPNGWFMRHYGAREDDTWRK